MGMGEGCVREKKLATFWVETRHQSCKLILVLTSSICSFVYVQLYLVDELFVWLCLVPLRLVDSEKFVVNKIIWKVVSYFKLEQYSTETSPSAQLVHAFSMPPKNSYPCLQNIKKTSMYPPLLLPLVTCYMYALSFVEWITPLVPFKFLPSHLKLVPSSFRLPCPREKTVTNHLIYAPHDFVHFAFTSQPPTIQRKKDPVSPCNSNPLMPLDHFGLLLV